MISTKGRYALRIMIDLAECERDALNETSADGDGSLTANAGGDGSLNANAGLDDTELNSGAAYIALKDVAERQGISKKYLEIIAKELVTAGLIKGTRGKSGGYKLTRKPEEYTIQEILDATEGELAAVACLAKDAAACPRSSICKTLPMWQEYDELTRNFFSNKHLSDLV